MCEICVKAQDAVPRSERGATYDAWARIDAAYRAWLESLPPDHEVFDRDLTEQLLAHARHIEETTAERVAH